MRGRGSRRPAKTQNPRESSWLSRSDSRTRAERRGFGCGVRKFGRTPQNIQFAGKTNLRTPQAGQSVTKLSTIWYSRARVNPK